MKKKRKQPRLEETTPPEPELHAAAPPDDLSLPAGLPRRDALIVLAVTLLVRIAYFATADGPAFRNPLIDGDQYDFIAEKMANGEGLPPEPFWQPPLFPLLLGALYRVFGHTFLAPRLLSATLTALTATMVADLVRRATQGRAAALASGLVVALYGPSIFYDGELLPTALGTFLGTAALWVALTREALFDRNITTGVVTGLAGISLGPLLFLAPVLGLVASGGQRLARSQRALRVFVTCAAALVIVLPVTVFNYRRSQELIPISANAGVNLWIGNNPEADKTFAVRPGEAWEAMLNEPVAAGITTAGGQDAYFSRKARAFCSESPGLCAAGLLHKARLLVVAREIPRNEDIYLLRRQSPILRATVWKVATFGFPFALLFPFAVGGILVGFASVEERTRRLTVAATLALFALALGPVLFLVAGRYRLPLLPPLALLAGVGLAGLPRWPRLATGGALAALVLTLLPAPLPVDAVDFEAEMWFVVGGRRERLGDLEGAIASYRHALERRPAYTEAGFNLGVLLETNGRPNEAVEVYRTLLSAQPGMFGVRYRLVQALLSSERLDDADRELDALWRDVPDHPTLMTSRAKLLLLRDDVSGAKIWAVRAMEMTQGESAEAKMLLELIEKAESAAEAGGD